MLWLRCAWLLSALCLAAGCAGLSTPAGQPLAPGAVLLPGASQPLSDQELGLRLRDTQVLLVGEVHDHPGHHQIQLRLLQDMADLPGPLVVGVEWLDLSAQAACDQLSAGALSVEQFAERVKWSERWGFPLELYAPILEFVRQRHLPLVALNAPVEVVRQVARQGLGSLSPQERALLAPALDLGDPAYRRLIAAQFKMHGMGHGPSPENFFTAQVARDETMAHRLAAALLPWPDSGRRAVVLVGAGHLAHGQGLPTRLARRLPGVHLLSALPVPAAGEPSPWQGLSHTPPADLLVISTPAPPPPPRLGVVLQAQDEGLLIQRVLPQTPAQRAGLQPGDILLAIDGQPLRQIKDIHDLIKAAPRGAHEYRVRRAGQDLSFTITLETPGG